MRDSRETATGSAQEAGSGSLREFRPGLFFGFFNAMTWQVALGTPMVLFAERLGASSIGVGLAYSFVFLLTPVQVLATALLPRFGYKRMMLSGWGMRSVFLLPPLLLAILAPEEGSHALIAVFIGSVFFFTLFRAVGSSAYLPWLNGLLSERIRGRYFASEQSCAGVGGVGTLLVSALTFRFLPLYTAFIVQYSIAFFGSAMSATALSRLPDSERPTALSVRDVLRAAPRMIAAPGMFRRFLLVSIWAGFAVSAIPPFCAYFLKVGPGLSASQIVLCTTCQYLGVISGALVLRSRVDRIGARPFFLASLAVYSCIAVCWIVMLRTSLGSMTVLFVLYFFLGIAATCWFSANMKYLPQVVEPGQKALAFAIHGAVTSLVSGLASVIWGFFIKGTSEAPSVDPVAFQIFFVVAIASVVGLALLVVRLPEGAAVKTGWLPAAVALRPFRALTHFASLVTPRNEPRGRTDVSGGRQEQTAGRN